jgi:Asp-tRNA(Asn)/Glu-tRNA(Gln) amidotransferase B subunit
MCMLFIGLKNYGGMLQVMKVSGGRVNPALLNKILLSKLNC